MKLLGSDGSPYARKARIAIAEKGVACEFVAASPRDPASGVSAANPLAKIPTLLLDDGTAIYDSSVIAEYADGIGAGPKLIPDTFAERVAVRVWEATGNGLLDATVNIMHDRRLPEAKQQGAEYVARQMQKIEAALALIDKTVAGADFVHGEKFSLGDVVCGTALGYLDRVLVEFDWRSRYANAKRYAAKLAARPSFAVTGFLTAEKPPR
ncbi:MAG TPA: glutathione S-transferase N-terminal domain-containing protein [Stellaceae bacterium]|jgi:glutathione S-transferase|nr:glutathione S-transferase N-terminal domain-containing protein [Stellaceae bacterium]